MLNPKLTKQDVQRAIRKSDAADPKDVMFEDRGVKLFVDPGSLGVLDGTQILVVEKITGHRAMPMLSQVGGMIPAYCSALGRAILAYSEPPVIDAALTGPLPARTARTLVSKTAIMRELTAIPERGWAIDREEGNIGVSCVAAPIFGPLGEVAAALSVTGPTQLVRADRIGPAVRMAAAATSRSYTARPRLVSR